MTVRLVLADDHQLFRDMFRLTLGRAGNAFEIVGEAGTPESTLRVVGEHAPDVVLLDLSLVGSPSDALITRLGEISPGTRVVIVTGRDDAASTALARSQGAAGYVLKRGAMEHVAEAIARVHAGERWGDPALPASAHARFVQQDDA